MALPNISVKIEIIGYFDVNVLAMIFDPKNEKWTIYFGEYVK